MKDLLVKLSRRVSFKKILRPLFAVQRKRTQNDKGGVLRLRLCSVALSIQLAMCSKIVKHYIFAVHKIQRANVSRDIDTSVC